MASTCSAAAGSVRLDRAPRGLTPPRRPRRASVRALLLALLAVGCDDGADSDAGVQDAGAGDAGPLVIPQGWPKAECDALDPSACALPWPSSLYLEPADTPSGARLTFGERSLPANQRRRPIAPAMFEGLDGYGLGVPVIADLGPLDYDALPREWGGIGASMEPDSPTLLFAVRDGALERVPHFVEPDLRAGDATITLLRPAVILEPATRYVVAFRDLTDPAGAPVEPSDAFRALRDGAPSEDAGIEARRARFEELFGWLVDAGVAREELVLAWDFVTGSEAALHRRLDQAIARSLEQAPDGGALVVDEAVRFAAADDGTGDEIDSWIRYRVRGRMSRPLVVEPAEAGPGVVMALDGAGDVTLAGEGDTDFLCNVPHRALEGEPEGVVVYGHGLFGNENEIRAQHLRRFAEVHGFVMCGVPMVGMSDADVEGVIMAINDLNGFGVLSDGLHQGLLDHHLFARAARRTLGQVLAAVDPAIAIDGDTLFFFGASQGGIFGQTLLATSPDFTRAVLAVPGNNYRTMLPRSTNFASFEVLLRTVYPSPHDRAVALSAIQLLWDRTDPVNYLGRMLEPERFGEPERRALLLLSKADYQVPVLTNEIGARTWPEALRVMDPYDPRVPYEIGRAHV
jgi:hypothetical protein